MGQSLCLKDFVLCFVVSKDSLLWISAVILSTEYNTHTLYFNGDLSLFVLIFWYTVNDINWQQMLRSESNWKRCIKYLIPAMCSSAILQEAVLMVRSWGKYPTLGTCQAFFASLDIVTWGVVNICIVYFLNICIVHFLNICEAKAQSRITVSVALLPRKWACVIVLTSENLFNELFCLLQDLNDLGKGAALSF